jgi:arylsulfatase A-like enzyme
MRPNILLFLTDDHGAWALGCHGNREVRSPVLDTLAAEGTRFAHAFTPCPVCSPARACLMTGRTPSQVGIHDWIQEAEPEFGDPDWLAEEITLPELLHDAGYHCGLSGKWHLGRSHVTPRGFDWCFGLPRWQGAHIQEYTYHLNGEPRTLTGNKACILTDYALDFLDRAPTDRPFFLNVGYIATHSPYANQEPELTALYDAATFSDIPDYVPHRWRRDEGLPGGEYSAEALRSRYQSYYAAVTDMDRNIGRLLERLRAQGRLEQTLVLYTSDHGCGLGHHGFLGKGNATRPLNMYETSLRVPLILRQPGVVAAGQVVERCVDHYDTFQALCEWAGVRVPERSHAGRSLAPLGAPPAGWSGETIDWDDTRFGEYGDLRMIRTPRFKLVKRYPDGPDELFDLQSDPREQQNLAGREEWAPVEAELQSRLEAWYAQHEDSAKSGLRVKELRQHNERYEAWRDGLREAAARKE